MASRPPGPSADPTPSPPRPRQTAALPIPSPAAFPGKPADAPPVAGWLPPEPGAARAGAAPASDEERLPPPRARRRSGLGWGREGLQALLLALLFVLAAHSAVQNFRVEGASMDPSLSGGEYVLVNKAVYFRLNLDAVHRFLPFVPGGDHHLRYLSRAPARGDVIVFRFPDNPRRNFVKRVIGVPGDRIEVREGSVYVDGQPQDESFADGRPRYVYGPATVPDGQYFVLGDNRNNSYDSHVWGMVPAENIIGQAWFTYWPLSRLGRVNNLALGP